MQWKTLCGTILDRLESGKINDAIGVLVLNGIWTGLEANLQFEESESIQKQVQKMLASMRTLLYYVIKKFFWMPQNVFERIVKCKRATDCSRHSEMLWTRKKIDLRAYISTPSHYLLTERATIKSLSPETNRSDLYTRVLYAVWKWFNWIVWVRVFTHTTWGHFYAKLCQ